MYLGEAEPSRRLEFGLTITEFLSGISSETFRLFLRKYGPPKNRAKPTISITEPDIRMLLLNGLTLFMLLGLLKPLVIKQICI